MSITAKIFFVISLLLLFDGMICLIFLDRFESALKRLWPKVDVVPIAAAEIFIGGLVAVLLLIYG